MIASARLVLLALLLTATVTRVLSELVYSCKPDNTIIVTGFTGSPSFYAVQGATVCKTTFTTNVLSITGCTKDKDILVTYGSYTDMEKNALLGGNTVNAFKVKCVEIAATGVAHSVTNAFTASLSIDATPSTEPTYSVTSSLSESTVTVGDSVTWIIKFPSSYKLEVTSCTAYPGTDNSDSDSLSLIDVGCSKSKELVSNFVDSGTGSTQATIEAFKFYKSTDVFLECNVKVCPSSSSNCVTSCKVQRFDHFFKRSSDVKDDNGYVSRQIHNVLTVTDPSENGAVTIKQMTWIKLVSLAFVIFIGFGHSLNINI